MLGGLGGLLGIGAVPVFGGTGGGPIPGGAAVVGALLRSCRRRGGGVQMGGGGVAASVAGGVTSKAASAILANLKQSISGWKDMLTNLGNIGFKPERWSMDESGT